MLNETKLALRIKTDIYDGEIARLIEAAVGDLGVVDVKAAGIGFTVVATTTGETVTDNSTLTDPLLIQAIITYVRLHFGSPDDYDKLAESYWQQKAQLISCTGYGLPEGC